MSGFTSDPTGYLDLAEKVLRLANLQTDLALKNADMALKRADTALKAEQTRWSPAQVVIAGMSAGGVLVGATATLTAILIRWKLGG